MLEALKNRRRSVADVVLAAEAAGWLTLAGVALRGMRFPRVAALAARWGRPFRGATADAVIERVGWAVRVAADRAPWGPLCFERGLAAHMMLRLRGQDSRLYYGARSDGSLGPSAHVWVRVGAREVVGCEEAARFATLAIFPAASTGRDS